MNVRLMAIRNDGIVFLFTEVSRRKQSKREYKGNDADGIRVRLAQLRKSTHNAHIGLCSPLNRAGQPLRIYSDVKTMVMS